MERKKFQRKIEDFKCDICGANVKGDGYTDHCPFCLWGKHVDVNPGDRAAECGGMMKPVSYEVSGRECRIYYECQSCGYKFKVKRAQKDDFEKILEIKKDMC